MMTLSRGRVLRGIYAGSLVVALGVFSVGAYAANSDRFALYDQSVVTVGYDSATRAPIEDRTVRFKVKYDPATLASDAGIADLNDSIARAASEACFTADPLGGYDAICVQRAIDSARDQMSQAIAQAKSETRR